jgi:hypothetical protein
MKPPLSLIYDSVFILVGAVGELLMRPPITQAASSCFHAPSADRGKYYAFFQSPAVLTAPKRPKSILDAAFQILPVQSASRTISMF